MKISFFETRDREQDFLTNCFLGHEVFFYQEKLDLKSVSKAKDTEIVSVFVGSEVNKEIIDALPHLKMIATRSTGFDHIDIAYAKSKGVAVTSVTSYGAHTVAEFAFGLMLNLSRKINGAIDQVKKEKKFDLNNFRGFDLFGKTLGVLGTGRIGKNSIRIGQGFGMKILATDLYPDHAFAEENGVEYVPLDALLSSSDILTIHTPYNETTFHLINKENITLIKKGALLINTARGEIVETEALISALKSGILAGAGLDVLEAERKFKEADKLRLYGLPFIA